MSIGWLRRKSTGAVAVAMGVAVAAGVSAGAWLDLPDYMAEPVSRAEPQVILAEDPGRARWNAVISSLGGLGATFVVPAYLYRSPAPGASVFYEEDQRLEAILAEVDAELEAAELQRSLARYGDWGWGQRQEEEPARLRRQAEAQAYAYAPAPYGYGPPSRYEPRDYARYESPANGRDAASLDEWAE